ncbi:hypothetical protein N0V93_002358 [Gnomoniopsis smithogilvyi]|uniref:Glutathione S-transferase UstS-like C-terminal domain-containing protein n=1 Tax=Gnomoniopsis smithogilvyi TaxID=1191159 RepID=A0A9W8YWK0_9PEZI|nr:hypothetical protein N0V93_002358 [Gnomoniopsis smithogilvyi]
MSDATIIFYDIASGPPVRCFAPNPWKTRYALNFKRLHNGLHYETSWTELPKVTEVRKSLGAAAVRKHDIDGGDFHTLPVIVDRSKGQTVGDSFDIALYLDQMYPSREGEPVLLPPSTVALHRNFNLHVDKIFTTFVVLGIPGIPFNPESAEISKAEFCRRAGRKSWDEFAVDGDARKALMKDYEAALGELAKLYVNRDKGPFLEGSVPMYADLIVGGWLAMMSVVLPEWEQLRGWHDGLFGQLHDALQKYAQCD